MTTLTVNPAATKQELVNEALAFSKYGSDAEAMEYLNEVLTELKYMMKGGEYQTFQERILKLVNEN